MASNDFDLVATVLADDLVVDWPRSNERIHGANHAFAALPGAWEVGQMPANLAAQAFSRQAIGPYTGGKFAEHAVTSGWWQGVVQCFVSSPR